MAQLYRLPDLPIEQIRYLDDDPDYIILMEKYFIKRILNQNINIDTFLQIADLNIEGFNNHKRVFIDDIENYIYLNAPYLNNHTEMISTLMKMNLKDILLLFKNLFENLQTAHTKNFNPFDIKFSNYLISPSGKPIFIDFDYVIYNNKCTKQKSTVPFFSNTFAFGLDNDIENPDTINNNDKLLSLIMLLQSIVNNYEINITDDLEKMNELYKILCSKYLLDPKIESYLEEIIINHNIPEKDDYFIDTIINPLLEDGISLKKQLIN